MRAPRGSNPLPSSIVTAMRIRLAMLRRLVQEAVATWSCGRCGFDQKTSGIHGEQCARCGEPSDFGPDDGSFLPGFDPESDEKYAFDVSDYDLGGFGDDLEDMGAELRNSKHPTLSLASYVGSHAEDGLQPGQTRYPGRPNKNRLPKGTFLILPMSRAEDFVRMVHDSYEDQEALWNTLRPKPPVKSKKHSSN